MGRVCSQPALVAAQRTAAGEIAAGAMSAVRNLFSVVGAGYSGSVVYNHQSQLGDTARRVAEAFGSSSASGAASSAASATGDNELFQRWLREADRMMANRVTVVQQLPLPSSSGGSTLKTVGTLVAVACGGAIVLRIRGYTLDKLLYVTRANFKDSMNALSQALAKAKDKLAQRIDALTSRLDHAAEMQDRIAEDVADIQLRVQGMGGMPELLQSMDGKLEFSHRGVYLLCAVLRDALKEGYDAKASEHIARLEQFTHEHAVQHQALAMQQALHRGGAVTGHTLASSALTPSSRRPLPEAWWQRGVQPRSTSVP